MAEKDSDEFTVVEGKDIEAVVVKNNSSDDELAEWSTKYINDLPDSAFVVVEPCSDENKNARHLPYKDKDGNVDVSHLRNAVARYNQIKAVCPDSSTEDLRNKAEARLKKLANEHLPDSQWAEDSEDNSEEENDNMSEEEMSELQEELKSLKEQMDAKDEVINGKDSEIESIKEALNEAKSTIEDINKQKFTELAESVFEMEMEIGIKDEDDEKTRMKELSEMDESTLRVLKETYNSLPENSNEDPDPKANVSENSDNETEDNTKDKLAELREKYFRHSDAKVKVDALGEDEHGNIRYIEVE